MKSDTNTKALTRRSAKTESRKASNASHKASADTSLPYHLTPLEIESMRQEFKEASKEMDELFAHIKPFKK